MRDHTTEVCVRPIGLAGKLIDLIWRVITPLEITAVSLYDFPTRENTHTLQT